MNYEVVNERGETTLAFSAEEFLPTGVHNCMAVGGGIHRLLDAGAQPVAEFTPSAALPPGPITLRRV